jgi:hypothetical protein
VTLAAARDHEIRLIISLAGHRNGYTDNGRFNFAKWKAKVDRFKHFKFDAYVKAGTIIGHFLVDEPFCDMCWGGKKISYSEIEAMASYSKSLWPSLPTGVRSPPSHLGSIPYSALDFGWAQWEGPLHFPTYRTTPEEFRDRETAAGKALGLAVVFGLNYLDAGDGTSHFNGTYAFDPDPSDNVICNPRYCYRYAMTASEVSRVGRVLAAASYGCALLSWQYEPAFISRPGVRDALKEIADIADQRPSVSCKGSH